MQRQYARKYGGTRIIRTPRNLSRVVCLGGGTFWLSGPGHETLEPFVGRGVDGCHGFMLEGSGSCFSRNRIGKRSFLGYLRVRSSQTHLINQWLERVCICKQTVNRRHVRLRKHAFLLARDIWEWNFCPLMRTFVSFINKRQSCFTHV